MTKPIYIFSGWSGAGKDTCGECVTHQLGLPVVKFADPGKRALEFMLKCPVGLMDDRVARLAIAPHCQGRSYLQVLIDFYHHKDAVIGRDLFTRQTLDNVRLHPDGCIITDMRSEDEAEAIADLSRKGYDVSLIWIGGGEKLSSDTVSSPIFLRLAKATGVIPRYIRGSGLQTKVEMLADVLKILT